MRTQTQECLVCNDTGEFRHTAQTSNGPFVSVISCPLCQNGNGANATDQPFDPPLNGAAPNLTDSARASPVLQPDEIISPPTTQIRDQRMELYVRGQMRKTANKQAAHLVAAYRQAELDEFRMTQSMKLYINLVAKSAEHMQRLLDYAESCDTYRHSEVAERVNEMTARGLDIFQNFPAMGIRYNLSRYGLG